MSQFKDGVTPQYKLFSSNMEVVIATLLVLLSLGVIVISRNFPGTGVETDIGSARFPIIHASMLIVLSIILIYQNYKNRNINISVSQTEDSASEFSLSAQEILNYKRSFTGITFTILCFLVINHLGYLITTVIYMSLMMWLLDMRHKIFNPLIAILITGLLYAVFSLALNVPLPEASIFSSI